MNYHLSPISFRRYSLILISVFFIIAIISWGMEIYFEKLDGGLTRIGSFPESDFGWHASSPHRVISSKDFPNLIIPAEYFKDYPLAEADILVIGDSFSVGRIWQTKLNIDGFKVTTLSWADLGGVKTLPPNLGEILHSMGFKGRYVIIESVERFFQLRMKSLAKKHYPIIKHDIMISSSLPIYPIRRSVLSMSALNGASWGLKAAYNTLLLKFKASEKYLRSDGVLAVKFNGCQFFSNKRCDYALFIDEDFTKESFRSIDNVLTVNKSLQQNGIQPIWLVVPDKATVYLGYGELNKYSYVNIWQQFSRYSELIAPNLGELFIQKSKTMKDFYLPNDTHLSTPGYLYLGEIVRNCLRDIKANKTNSVNSGTKVFWCRN